MQVGLWVTSLVAVEKDRVNIVVRLEAETDDGFESRVIGTLLDALEGEGLEADDVTVVAV